LIFGGLVEEGDWVVAKRVIPVSFSDHLTDSGIAEGTRGVVISSSWGYALVEFNDGFGAVRVDVKKSDLRVVKKRGGVVGFRERSRRLTIVRVGALIAILAPLVWYAAQYWWYYRSFNGFIPALALGALESAGDFLAGAFADPVRAVIFLLVTGVTAHLAFGTSRRRRK